MLYLLSLVTLGLTSAGPQLTFGGGGSGSSSGSDTPVNPRLGLLGATHLNTDPLGRQEEFPSAPQSSAFTQQDSPGSRIPSSGSSSGFTNAQQCCCVPFNQDCGLGDPYQGEDLVGLGLIDARAKNRTGSTETRSSFGISTRIVNRPSASTNTNAPQVSCAPGQKTCCYDASIDFSIFGQTCINPQSNQERWFQGCQDNVPPTSTKSCGTREYSRPVSGLSFGQSSPGEFPWTCLLLNQNNDFIGTCAVIPSNFRNDNSQGTRKVITAAHKLKALGETDLLKVRVGEWDASGFNPPEVQTHQEYTVTRILKHPQFNPRRLSNDIALLTLDRNIDLNHPYVNTACLPSCDNQFDHLFSNGTGTLCWVAGWGKDEESGDFQFIQRKVELPLVPEAVCEVGLARGLKRSSFSLDPVSEVCAGGVPGKDACTGDGGSPLVCQSDSGRWTVVGLVTWGIGCASEIPGVYARVAGFRSWIDSNN